jgi:hypothetical protein
VDTLILNFINPKEYTVKVAFKLGESGNYRYDAFTALGFVVWGHDWV